MPEGSTRARPVSLEFNSAGPGDDIACAFVHAEKDHVGHDGLGPPGTAALPQRATDGTPSAPLLWAEKAADAAQLGGSRRREGLVSALLSAGHEAEEKPRIGQTAGTQLRFSSRTVSHVPDAALALAPNHWHVAEALGLGAGHPLSLIHISEPTRPY